MLFGLAHAHINNQRECVGFFCGFGCPNTLCPLKHLLFYSTLLSARVCKCGDGTSSCVVAMTTSSALFIGHSISVAASRDRPKAIDRADM